MKVLVIGVAAFAATCLAGCQREASPGSTHHGRYVGVGIYSPGDMWSKMAVAGSPKEAAAARTSDDEQVIVVIDSDTGEVRQCGNLTGYCVGMNPWAKPLTTSQAAPVALTEHAAPHAPYEEAAAPAAQPRSR